jgi:hypothetical protein
MGHRRRQGRCTQRATYLRAGIVQLLLQLLAHNELALQALCHHLVLPPQSLEPVPQLAQLPAAATGMVAGRALATEPWGRHEPGTPADEHDGALRSA